MGLDYTSTGLLANIRDVTGVGSSNRDWPDVRMLRLVNRMIEEYLVPFIASARKNHFDTFNDQPLVAGQANYYLPSAAVGLKARAILLVDSTGAAYAKLQERELEDAVGYGAATGTPSAYWFQGNQVWLYPTPSGSPALSLRIHYLNRPSALVAASGAVLITGTPAGAPGGSYRASFTGSAPAGFIASAGVDIVRGVPGFDIPQTTTITAVNAGSLDILGTKPATIGVGDWVCLAGTAPVVTGAIPEMVVGCLVRKCQLEILATASENAVFDRAHVLLGAAEKSAHQFLNRRNTGDRPKFGKGSTNRFKRGGWAGSW